jgi:hypothetical protein
VAGGAAAQGSKKGGRMDISNERQKCDFLH